MMTSSGRWRGPTAPTACGPWGVMLLAACLLLALPGPAHADPPAFAGTPCGFSAMDDPTGDTSASGQEVGEVNGGPYAVADAPGDLTGNPASATLTCTLQVGGTGAYTDPDAAYATVSGTGVVVLPPALVTYTGNSSWIVYVCTRLAVTDVHGDAVTYYYDAPSRAYVTDPAAARCQPQADV
jgi:hypothetical protein